MDYLSEKDVLKCAIDGGMIDFNALQKKVEMNERKKYLEKHKQEIWKSSDGKWHTYVPDDTKDSGRRRIKRNTKESLDDALIEFYKESEEEITLKRLFYEWTEKKTEYGEVQKQTIDKYERDFKRFFGKSDLENRKVKYIDEYELEDFIRKTIHEQELSAKAWSGLRTLINGMFKYGKKRGYTKIQISVFMSELELSRKIFRKKEKEEFENVFTEKEIDLLSEYLKKNQNLNNLAILLGMHTGMRVGEIVALKHEDIFEDYIYVHRTQIRYLGEDGKDVYEIRDCPKTDAGVRKVVISKNLRPVINRIRMMNMANDYLFYDEKNKKIKTIHAITCALYRACGKVGIPERSMHVLRKTYATRLINSGIDESIIISQLGHTDISTTKQFYYYNDKLIGQVREKIENAINY